MHLTLEQCDEILDAMPFERDDRNPADGRRLGRFRQGWRDATLRRRDYTTLDRLVWQNLGYRLGLNYGEASDEEIEDMFWSFASHFRQRGRIRR